MADDAVGVGQDGVVAGQRGEDVRFDPDAGGFVDEDGPQDRRDGGDQGPAETVALEKFHSYFPCRNDPQEDQPGEGRRVPAEIDERPEMRYPLHPGRVGDADRRLDDGNPGPPGPDEDLHLELEAARPDPEPRGLRQGVDPHPALRIGQRRPAGAPDPEIGELPPEAARPGDVRADHPLPPADDDGADPGGDRPDQAGAVSGVVLPVGVQRDGPVGLSREGRKAGQEGRPLAAVFFMPDHGDPLDPFEVCGRPIGRTVVDDPDRKPQPPGPFDHRTDPVGVVIHRNEDRKAVGSWQEGHRPGPRAPCAPPR